MDISLIDASGDLFEGEGLEWSDWYAYNKGVLASADGTVVAAIDGTDFPLKQLMKQDKETWEEYRNRIGSRQLGLFSQPGSDLFQVAGGNYIVIKHANDEYSWYAHLAGGSIKVSVGQKVKQGDVIAGVGGTGENPHVHLHFQVTDGPEPTSGSVPFTFIDAIAPKAVLNTRKPHDAGRFIWLDRPGFPKAQ